MTKPFQTPAYRSNMHPDTIVSERRNITAGQVGMLVEAYRKNGMAIQDAHATHWVKNLWCNPTIITLEDPKREPTNIDNPHFNGKNWTLAELTETVRRIREVR